MELMIISEWPYMDENMTLERLKEYLKYRFPDRDRSSKTQYSILFDVLQKYGPRRFRALDEMVKKNIDWIRKREENIPDSLRRLHPRRSDAGAVAWILCERALKIKYPDKSLYIE